MQSTEVSGVAVLFPWNPKTTNQYKWPPKFQACTPLIDQLRRGKPFPDTWNIGYRRSVPGDATAYLVRVSGDHPGVVLSGKTVSGERIESQGPFQTRLRWSRGIEWIKYPPMPLSEVFVAKRAKSIGLSLQQPGHTISASDAARLAKAWSQWVQYYTPSKRMDVGTRRGSHASSGAERCAMVHEARAYEGSSVLRAKVVGLTNAPRCECCRMSPQKKYGEAFDELLEVHHCEQLHLRGRRRKIDTVVLLCPSCHRAVHQCSPPMAPSLLRAAIKQLVVRR